MQILNTYRKFSAIIILLVLSMMQYTYALDKIDINRIDDKDHYVTIYFQANQNDPNDLDAIRLYEASGFTNDRNDFKLIREYDFTNYPKGIDSIDWNFQNNSLFTIKSNNFPNDKEMSYFMTAVKGNYESEMTDSTYFYYSKGPKDSIIFSNFPPNLTRLELNGEFYFQAKASSLLQHTLEYKLVNPPNDDAQIDKNTGMFSYKATQTGKFKFTIRAYDANNTDSYADQYLNVEVYKCYTNVNGMITINNESPQFLERGSVDIYRVTKDSIEYVTSTPVYKNGQFFTLVDEGKYIAHFNGYIDNQNLVAWYQGKDNQNNADKFETTCGDTTELTWNIKFTNTANYNIILNEIVKFPYETVKKGDKFEKQLTYSTSPKDQEVVFTLSNKQYFSLTGPNNETLTLNTSEPGIYETTVICRMKDFPNIVTSKFVKVWVTECDELKTLSVNVLDIKSNENVKKYISAYIYSLDETNNDTLFYSTYIDSNSTQEGVLQFNLDKGAYFLEMYVTIKDNNQQYSNYRYIYSDDRPTGDSTSPRNGEIIQMDCENQNIDWKIRVPQAVNYHKISGKVTDEKTGDPVKFAQVQLIGKNKLTDKISIQATYTNENGLYSFGVKDDAIYIISAGSFSDSSITEKEYLPEFWKETDNPLEAENIELTKDYQDINFTLTEKPDYKNSLNGYVYDEDDKGVGSIYLIAYLVEPTNFDEDVRFKSYSTRSNKDGSFDFENIIPGNYIVYTFTYGRDYKPGYYISNDLPLIQKWQKATKIEVNESGNFGDIEIRLSPFKGINSNNTLRGKVSRMKSVSPGTPAEGDPLLGVAVIVADDEGNIKQFGYSEKEGKFDISNLPIGKWNVYFDKVGYESSNDVINVNENGKEIYLDVELNKLSTTDVQTFEAVNAKVYPNPTTTGIINITGEYTPGNYTAKVIDMAGNIVLIKQLELTFNKSTLDLSKLMSGQYIIKLFGKYNNYSSKVKIIR